MRYASIRMHGIRPYREDVSVDLEALPGPIIAIHGPNGAGKSTFAEMLTAGPYRTTPSHGDVKDMSVARDSYVEVVVENGKRYTIRHQVDAATGKGESVVTKGAGRALLDTTKVSAFDAWAKAHFPPPEVYFAGPFCAQLSTGLLGMTSGDRMAVVLRALGIERYEAMAERARKRAAAVKVELSTLVARAADEQSHGVDVETAERELRAAQDRAVFADGALEEARSALSAAEAETRAIESARAGALEFENRRASIRGRLVVAQEQWASLARRVESCQAVVAKRAEIEAAVAKVAELDAAIVAETATMEREAAQAESQDKLADSLQRQKEAALGRHREAKAKVDELTARVADLEKRIAANRGLLDRADEIRSAVARDAELAAEWSALETELERRRADLARAQQDVQTHERRRLDAATRKAAAEKRAQAARSRLADREAIEGAVAVVESLRDKAGVAAQELLAAEEALESLRGQRVAGAEQRIEGLRGGLQRVIDEEDGEGDGICIARDTLAADDSAVRLAADLPKQINAAGCAVLHANKGLEDARRLLSDTERVAARAGELEQAEAELRAADHDARSAGFDVETAQLAVEQSRTVIDECGPDIETAIGRQAAIADERKPLAPTIALAEHLAQAETRIAERSAQLTQTRADLDAAKATARAADAEADQLRKSWSQAVGASTHHGALEDEARKRAEALSGERVTLVSLAGQAPDVARAATQLAELEPQLANVRREVVNCEAELAALPEPAPAISPPDTAAMERQVAEADSSARAAHAAVAVAETRLVDANARAGRLEALAGERAQAEEALADWTLLADSLGREGIQAAEVDAVTPELTERTNDLLHHACGNRFTVTWETTKLDAKGKKQLEECRIRVIDTEDGGDRDGKLYSPGQRAILDLGCSLALTMVSCRNLGIERPTLVRDESDAPMTDESSAAFIPMLRRAADIIDADKVLVITHHPRTVELADSRILVADGKVTVQA